MLGLCVESSSWLVEDRQQRLFAHQRAAKASFCHSCRPARRTSVRREDQLHVGLLQRFRQLCGWALFGERTSMRLSGDQRENAVFELAGVGKHDRAPRRADHGSDHFGLGEVGGRQAVPQGPSGRRDFDRGDAVFPAYVSALLGWRRSRRLRRDSASRSCFGPPSLKVHTETPSVGLAHVPTRGSAVRRSLTEPYDGAERLDRLGRFGLESFSSTTFCRYFSARQKLLGGGWARRRLATLGRRRPGAEGEPGAGSADRGYRQPEACLHEGRRDDEEHDDGQARLTHEEEQS
jgi:hypothetical protein